MQTASFHLPQKWELGMTSQSCQRSGDEVGKQYGRAFLLLLG